MRYDIIGLHILCGIAIAVGIFIMLNLPNLVAISVVSGYMCAIAYICGLVTEKKRHEKKKEAKQSA